MIKNALLITVFAGMLPSLTLAAADPNTTTLDVTMFAVSSDSKNDSIGTVRLQSKEAGVLLTPDLKGLKPGLHGFHLHENGSCDPAEKDGKPTAAAAAGDHFNPDGGGHRGPFEKGHTGDLPALYFNDDGEATTPVLAPNLQLENMKNRALVIHAGSDNYADSPEPLGGGGARVACGVIEGD